MHGALKIYFLRNQPQWHNFYPKFTVPATMGSGNCGISKHTKSVEPAHGLNLEHVFNGETEFTNRDIFFELRWGR